MANFNPFTSYFSIGVSWLKICNHSEEGVEEDVDATYNIWVNIWRTGVYSRSGRGFTETAVLEVGVTKKKKEYKYCKNYI